MSDFPNWNGPKQNWRCNLFGKVKPNQIHASHDNSSPAWENKEGDDDDDDDADDGVCEGNPISGGNNYILAVCWCCCCKP